MSVLELHSELYQYPQFHVGDDLHGELKSGRADCEADYSYCAVREPEP